MRKLGCLLLIIVTVFTLMGCANIGKEQQEWIRGTHTRIDRYCVLMDRGETTPTKDQNMLLAMRDSYALWVEKFERGIAAPTFLLDELNDEVGRLAAEIAALKKERDVLLEEDSQPPIE